MTDVVIDAEWEPAGPPLPIETVAMHRVTVPPSAAPRRRFTREEVVAETIRRAGYDVEAVRQLSLGSTMFNGAVTGQVNAQQLLDTLAKISILVPGIRAPERP